MKCHHWGGGGGGSGQMDPEKKRKCYTLSASEGRRGGRGVGDEKTDSFKKGRVISAITSIIIS